MRIGLGIAAATLPLLAACGNTDASSPDPVATTPSESSSTPAPSNGSEDPTSAPSSGTTPADTAPIYYLGATPEGQRLFAEEHPVAGGGADSLIAAMTEAPLDPDYRTLLPDGAKVTVANDDSGSGAILLDVDPTSTWIKRGSLTRAEARLAVQQVIYTLRLNDPTMTGGLYAFSEGEPVTLFGVDTSAGVKEADFLQVAALANILSPAEGTVVTDSTLMVQGLSSSFEAAGPLTVTDSSGAVVLDSFYQADGWMEKLYPSSTTLDLSGLAPGNYVLSMSTDDPSGGAEGSDPTTDTRSFVIE